MTDIDRRTRPLMTLSATFVAGRALGQTANAHAETPAIGTTCT